MEVGIDLNYSTSIRNDINKCFLSANIENLFIETNSLQERFLSNIRSTPNSLSLATNNTNSFTTNNIIRKTK